MEDKLRNAEHHSEGINFRKEFFLNKCFQIGCIKKMIPSPPDGISEQFRNTNTII